jgi:hypothetical protein
MKNLFILLALTFSAQAFSNCEMSLDAKNDADAEIAKKLSYVTIATPQVASVPGAAVKQ